VSSEPSRTPTSSQHDALEHLGDFTTTTRVLPIGALAICIGVFAAYVAAALLRLINFFTNLFFFQRFSIEAASPAAAANHLGAFLVFVPIVGAFIVGIMARYGSE